VPGAVAAAAGWTVLQAVGAYVVHHFLRGDSVYGVFATVLGLLAWIYLAVEITVYAAEINVMLARQLWPRPIIQPPLTQADRAVLAAQARQNQRRDDQHVEVSFDDQPRLRAGSSQAVIGHSDWLVGNLRWSGDKLLVVHDWDSVTADSEAVLVGFAAALHSTVGTDDMATVEETEQFLAAYCHARDREFSGTNSSGRGQLASGRGPTMPSFSRRSAADPLPHRR